MKFYIILIISLFSLYCDAATWDGCWKISNDSSNNIHFTLDSIQSNINTSNENSSISYLMKLYTSNNLISASILKVNFYNIPGIPCVLSNESNNIELNTNFYSSTLSQLDLDQKKCLNQTYDITNFKNTIELRFEEGKKILKIISDKIIPCND